MLGSWIASLMYKCKIREEGDSLVALTVAVALAQSKKDANGRLMSK